MKKPFLKAGFQQDKQQQNLRKEYGIEKDVVVVERKSRIVLVWKSTLLFLFTAVRITALAAIGILTLLGIASLVFPGTRGELLSIFTNAVQEIHTYFS